MKYQFCFICHRGHIYSVVRGYTQAEGSPPLTAPSMQPSGDLHPLPVHCTLHEPCGLFADSASVWFQAFARLDRLKCHERMHTGEKYKCDLCDAAFLDTMARRRHMKKHAERKYVCDTCGRPFTDEKSLHRHKRNHTGECFWSESP